MTTNSDVAFLYVAASVPALIVTFGLESVVLWTAAPLPDWLHWPLNVVPATAGGLAVYWVVAHWTLRHLTGAGRGGVGGHAVRSSSMYLGVLAGAAAIATTWDSPDFGLFGQLFVWSSATWLGGIVADAAESWRRTGIKDV